jgi:drug/metabolite transporter (DMT)-like permease
MGVLLGLSAAFCWGTSDFLAARVARSIGALRALVLTQSIGVLGVAALLLWRGQATEVTPRVVLIMLGIGLAQAVSAFLFYRAFEIGKLSLVAPITSGFAVVTAILALLSGERPGPLALGGALLLIIGVLFVTSHHRGQSSEATVNLRGVPEAIIAALGYGVVFWGLDFVVPSLGPFWPLAALRVEAVFFLGLSLLILRPPPQSDEGENNKLFWPVIGVAAADLFAWLSFNVGTQRADVAVVTALSSLYSATAIFYGWLIWRERLARSQWIGVGLILIGVLLVGVK